MSDNSPPFDNLAHSAPIEEIRDRLASNFGNVQGDPTSHPELWDKLWQEKFIPWDKYKPNPALVETFNTVLLRQPLPPPSPANQPDDQSADTTLPTPDLRLPEPAGTFPQGSRRRALVPGCGRGYDVFYLASAGYDAVGLDVSPEATKQAKDLHQKLEAEGWVDYPLLRPAISRGSVTFRIGDFFTGDWQTEQERSEGWDLIYDYTFLSALPPVLRPSWSGQMSNLLHSGGHLLCVEFPVERDPLDVGPPWPLPTQVYLAHLSHPGVEIPYDVKTGHVRPLDQTPGSAGSARPFRRIAHWKARKFHDRGQGVEWVGLFERE